MSNHAGKSTIPSTTSKSGGGGAASSKKSVSSMATKDTGKESTTEYQEDYRQIMLAYDTTPRVTDPMMTVFEKSLIIGKRATAIAYGSEPLIDVPARMVDVVEIAEEELRQKKTPYIVRRDLGNSKYEFWKIRDMIVSFD
jgi:DNA-directed RNA polymerase I, II, and III subunit RPABC2